MINLISKQIGRNDPCWCGSGIKFKKCHLDRESQDKVNHWDSAKEFKKTFSKRYCCVPDELKHECGIAHILEWNCFKNTVYQEKNRPDSKFLVSKYSNTVFFVFEQ